MGENSQPGLRVVTRYIYTPHDRICISLSVKSLNIGFISDSLWWK